MRADNRIRIYPEYFDATLTRAQGRRVSKKLALENPTLLELKLSAQKLKYTVEIDENRAYPRHWEQANGLLYLSTSETLQELAPKTQILHNLSKTVKEFARPKIKELKEEKRAKELQASKKGKTQGNPSPSRNIDKKQAGKPLRRRR